MTGMRFSLLSLVTLSLVATSPACLNISGTNLDGHRHDAEGGRESTRYHLLEKQNSPINWTSRLKKLESAMAEAPTLRDRSDYGGVLVHLGQYEKARDVLSEAEADSSGEKVSHPDEERGRTPSHSRAAHQPERTFVNLLYAMIPRIASP